MRVFVTGSTGYVGSAVVNALLRGGHRVTGLVRSDEKERALRALGVEPARGELSELARLKQLLEEHDALVHLAFDATLLEAADYAALWTLLNAARKASAQRAVVYTSGVWVLGATKEPADEDAPVDHPAAVVAWRPAHERMILEGGSHLVSTAVIRPGIVYGEKRGLASSFFDSAAKRGAAAYVGDGQNRWAMIHREDLAELYRTVVEKRARGVLHGVDGAAPRVIEMARAASEAAGRNGATRYIPLEEARQTMGAMADALCMDQVVAGPRANALGWKPRWRPFLESAKAAFEEWSAA